MLFPAKRAMNVSRRRAGAHPQRPGPERSLPMKNQTFGIEIETTGLGCERTAQAILKKFLSK